MGGRAKVALWGLMWGGLLVDKILKGGQHARRRTAQQKGESLLKGSGGKGKVQEKGWKGAVLVLILVRQKTLEKRAVTSSTWGEFL